MGEINFLGETIIDRSAIGENPKVIFKEGRDKFIQVEAELKQLRELLIAEGKGNNDTLNAIDKSIEAANDKDESKLKTHLKTLREYVGSFLNEFSITFLSSILVKSLLR
jgi:hypothetical protein